LRSTRDMDDKAKSIDARGLVNAATMPAGK
jgi:hypothetical protein